MLVSPKLLWCNPNCFEGADPTFGPQGQDPNVRQQVTAAVAADVRRAADHVCTQVGAGGGPHGNVVGPACHPPQSTCLGLLLVTPGPPWPGVVPSVSG